MRLTLRKFYLLLGEHIDRERMADSRAYKMIAPHLKEPPDPGILFPSLRDRSAANADANDAAIFQQVSASLMPYK
jgi:hypothetical protein